MARSKVELFEQIRRDRRIEGLSIRELTQRHWGAPAYGASSAGQCSPTATEGVSPPGAVGDRPLRRGDRRVAAGRSGRTAQAATHRTAGLAAGRRTRRDAGGSDRVVALRRPTPGRVESGPHRGDSAAQAHPAGAEAEVDFGECRTMIAGVLTTLWLFVMRLSHSGKAFHVTVGTQAQEAFLEGHVAAFQYFGGVPARIRYVGDHPRPSTLPGHWSQDS